MNENKMSYRYLHDNKYNTNLQIFNIKNSTNKLAVHMCVIIFQFQSNFLSTF